MSSKLDRALHGPSWTEVTLGAFLSVVVGVVLAAVWLMLKPVETVRELPKEPAKGVVYYVEGSSNSTQGRMWLSKRQSFVAGQSVTVTEQELNTAFKTLSAEAAKAEKAAKEEGQAGEDAAGMVTPGAVNFRIQEGQLQIGAPVDLNIFGLLQSKVQVVAQGTFERSGEGFVFAPDKFYVGSCRVDKLPVIGGMIMDKLLTAANLPADLTEAWGKLAGVTIDGAQLQLVMP